jgi:hypothetical protein
MILDLDPQPTKPPDLAHWLVVKEWDPDSDDSPFEIEHHPDCPTELSSRYSSEDDPDFTYETHDCIFQQMVDDMGIDSYFQHRDDPAKDDPYTERVAPGRWPIEYWEVEYRGCESTEYDAGLRLVES